MMVFVVVLLGRDGDAFFPAGSRRPSPRGEAGVGAPPQSGCLGTGVAANALLLERDRPGEPYPRLGSLLKGPELTPAGNVTQRVIPSPPGVPPAGPARADALVGCLAAPGPFPALAGHSPSLLTSAPPAR